MLNHDALTKEAVRIHGRYAREVVEGLGFCPWSAGARCEGRVRTVVIFGAEPDLERTLQEMEALSCEESADIGLLVFPQLMLGRVDFQHFAARVRERYERPGTRGDRTYALADFHPDATPDLGSAARLVPFIRRSPDPTLQLIRHSALHAVRRGEPHGTRFVDASALHHGDLENSGGQSEPLHARLARANLETVLELGVERVSAVLDDILRDRDQSYAQLGLLPPPWSPRRTPPDAV